ncbi:hypothetical protein J3F83DRAFT_1988 [Trichoderma novae-zelandiae]
MEHSKTHRWLKLCDYLCMNRLWRRYLAFKREPLPLLKLKLFQTSTNLIQQHQGLSHRNNLHQLSDSRQYATRVAIMKFIWATLLVAASSALASPVAEANPGGASEHNPGKPGYEDYGGHGDHGEYGHYADYGKYDPRKGEHDDHKKHPEPKGGHNDHGKESREE